MSVPVAVVAARVAAVLLDDILEWAVRIGLAALLLLLIPLSGVVLGFGGILALFGGLSGTADGGGPVWGGPPTTVAVGQIPAEQLVVMQQAARSAPCTLPWTVLAAIASIESEFGRTADRTVFRRGLRLWPVPLGHLGEVRRGRPVADNGQARTGEAS